MGFETPAEIKPEFEETVNGVRILCNIGQGDTWYSLYLPGIASEPTIPLSEDPEMAKDVFEYAKELAEEGTDLKTIYSKCEKYFGMIMDAKNKTEYKSS